MFKKFLFNMVKIITIFIVLFIIVLGYIFIDNCNVKVSNYSIYSDRLPPIFNNYKIALITDFHNSNNSEKIIKRIKEISPKLIIIAGDAINMNDTIFDNVGLLADGIVQIAPVYFSSGNHETWSKNETDFLTYIKNRGIIVLNNKTVEIEYKNNKINLVGYKDIVYADEKMRLNILENELEELYNNIENKNLFNILIFHRANYFEIVAKYPFDLVLSGHLHGGHINLPIIKEKILLNTFNTTKYSKQYYKKNNSQMIISTGAEKNLRYPRIFNTPEVVSVTIKFLR